MKTYSTFMALTEDKDRFIKNHPGLEQKQKDELINFFKSNKQAESLIDWNKAKDLEYQDFVDVMTKFKSGRKTVLKHKSISGIEEEEDYIRIKLKRKDFLAYSPLTHDGSEMLASGKVGPCRGKWCVAHTNDTQYWNEYALENKDVFVYLMNTEEKWAIQIKSNNTRFLIWNHEDNHIDDDGIPGFNVEEELLTPALKKVYDEIREGYPEPEDRIDTEAAESDFSNLITDIEEAYDDYGNAGEEYDEECARIKSDTLEQYEERRDAANEILDAAQEKYDAARAELEKWTADPTYRIWDHEAGEVYVFPERYEEYVVDPLKDARDEAHDEWNELDDKYNEIDDISTYDMYDANDIDWSEDPPSSDYMYENINYPNVHGGRYSDYFDLWENHGGGGDRGELQSGIYEYVTDQNGGGNANSLLNDYGFYDPATLNEN